MQPPPTCKSSISHILQEELQASLKEKEGLGQEAKKIEDMHLEKHVFELLSVTFHYFFNYDEIEIHI